MEAEYSAHYSRLSIARSERMEMNRKVSGLVTAAVGAAVLVTVGLSSGAVTNANGGLNLRDSKEGNVVSSGTVNPGLVNLDGKIVRVASGTTTKTLTSPGGQGCGNLSIAWQNYNAPSQYNTVTKSSSWNAGGTCGGFVPGTVNSRFTYNNGTHSSEQNILDGGTRTSFFISSGTATTKVEWELYGSTSPHNVCIIAAPWGSAQTYTPCSS